MRASLARSLLLATALVAAAFGVLAIRSLHEGQKATLQAEAAFDRGDLRACIEQAERAASMSFPGAAHVERGFARLLVVARGAEAKGEGELAIRAWEAIRAAAVEGGSALASPRQELSQANQNLARLRSQRPTSHLGTVAPAELERELLRQLGAPPAVSGALLAAVALGFSLTAGGILWAAFRGLSPEGRFSPRPFATGLLVTAVGVACWTIAVYRA